MARTYLSFLGTNDYLNCTYFKDDKELKNVRFVQEATLKFFCDGWTSEDRIFIFTTDESYRKNWMDNGHRDHDDNRLERTGLKSCIESLNLSPTVQRVQIPEGKSEHEIWQIFQLIYELIGKNDEMIFDITHAFRSIPMLAIVVLNYAKVMKNITLRGIYYGAFEVLGSIPEAKKIDESKRRVPILDLTSFDQLMDWSFAIDRFLGAGDAVPISKLANESVKSVLVETKGQDTAAGTIRTIANNLVDFTRTMSTCRGRNICNVAGSLKNNMELCENLDLVKPFEPIFNRIKNQINVFSGSEVLDGIEAAEWCLRHNLIQQGYTILQETLVTYFIIQIRENPEDQNYREIAGQAIKIFCDKLAPEKWNQRATESREVTEKILKFLENRSHLADVFRNLSKERNDLNHAGLRPNSMSAEKFGKKLLEYIKVLRDQTAGNNGDLL